MKIENIENMIPNLTGVAVLVIAVSAFALSFFNLQATAVEAGINIWLSWLWPICIDMLLISGSLMVLRSSLRDESTQVGWSVLMAFTLVSMGFNIIHSPPDWVSQAAHAIPPVALCISIELLMMCIRSDLSRSPKESATVKEVAHTFLGPSCNLGGIDIEKLASETFPVPVDNGKFNLIYPGKTDQKRKLVTDYFTEHPDSTMVAAAEALGMSRTTVTRYYKKCL